MGATAAATLASPGMAPDPPPSPRTKRGWYICRVLSLESLFRDLNDRGGRYVLVGGLAVVLHGHLRALKRQAGRPEDLSDVESLIEIKRLRAEGA